jgi:predicted RNA binding protein YcfA (HicA-like mRNA interferase family)
MPQLPLLSGKQVVNVLAKFGYKAVRQRGSYMRLLASGREPVTVPNYSTIDRALLRKILRDARLTVEQFASALR